MGTCEDLDVCGIYKVTCITNNKIYVGSSINIKRRWKEHKSLLNRDVHRNPHLQNAWNLYGLEAFNISILEECSEDILLEREEYWLLETKCTDNNIGFNVESDPITCSSMANNRSKEYIVTFPDGKEERIKNLDKFCRDNNIRRTALHAIVKGVTTSYNGYTCRHATESKVEWEEKVKNKKTRWRGKWLISYVDGTTRIIDNLTKFSREEGYIYACLYCIFTGRNKKHKDIIKVERYGTQANK